MLPTPKHHHRIVPIILITFSLPIVALGIFVVLADLLVHDIPMPSDPSLQLPDVSIAAVDNAFTELHQIDQRKTFPNNGDNTLTTAIDAPTWDETYVAGVITKYAKDIELFRAAAKKPVYQSPEYSHPSTFDFRTATYPSLWSYRMAAATVALEAEHRARAGDVNGGLEEALDVVRVGSLSENGQGTIIEYLVGSAIKHMGLLAIRQIALSSTITPAQSLDVAGQLEPFRDSREGTIKAMKLEYLGAKFFPETFDEYLNETNLSGTVDANGNTVMNTKRIVTPLSPFMSFYYMPHRTIGYLLSDAKERVRQSAMDCTIVDANPVINPLIPHPGLSLIVTPNAIGKLVADIGRISLGGLSTRRCNESLAISATEAIMATKAFVSDHVQFPSTLADLVPTYLPAFPIDPYNGKVLHYDTHKKTIYSVGPNRKDLGGSAITADWQHADNPSFLLSR